MRQLCATEDGLVLADGCAFGGNWMGERWTKSVCEEGGQAMERERVNCRGKELACCAAMTTVSLRAGLCLLMGVSGGWMRREVAKESVCVCLWKESGALRERQWKERTEHDSFWVHSCDHNRVVES